MKNGKKEIQQIGVYNFLVRDGECPERVKWLMLYSTRKNRDFPFPPRTTFERKEVKTHGREVRLPILLLRNAAKCYEKTMATNQYPRDFYYCFRKMRGWSTSYFSDIP